MLLTVLVPWRDAGCPYRQASHARIVAHLTATFPGVYVTDVDDGGEVWSRGQSIDAGVRDSGSDVFLVMDADGYIAGAQLRAAVHQAIAAPGQVLPFTTYRYLDAETTAAFIAADEIGSLYTWKPTWVGGTSVGGACAFTRETHEAAGGHDPRFRGWGAQDKQFHAACAALVARPRRVGGLYLHLYHPVDPTNDPALPGYQANMALRDRYLAARRDPAAMRALVAEGAAATPVGR